MPALLLKVTSTQRQGAAEGRVRRSRVVIVNSAHSGDDGESSDGDRRQLTGYIWNIIHH